VLSRPYFDKSGRSPCRSWRAKVPRASTSDAAQANSLVRSQPYRDPKLEWTQSPVSLPVSWTINAASGKAMRSILPERRRTGLAFAAYSANLILDEPPFIARTHAVPALILDRTDVTISILSCCALTWSETQSPSIQRPSAIPRMQKALLMSVSRVSTLFRGRVEIFAPKHPPSSRDSQLSLFRQKSARGSTSTH
jgi:hypothetical protein